MIIVLRMWWNRQTRQIKGLVMRVVQVQVLSSAPRQSKLYIACSDFFVKNQSSLMPQLFLVRKKARLAHLFTCKRVLDGSLSLPPFCESGFGTVILDFTVFLIKHCKNTCTISKQAIYRLL